MPVELIILIASLAVAWLVFTWLVKVIKASVSSALLIAGLVLVLQLIFGIGPGDLWQQVISLPQTLWELVTGSPPE
ncbi:MAG: hypothetical protein HC890_04885 [Chloroflexaceae bacterium]|nr:hypothetical protein [Chloroflexaceae bacterium]